MDNTEDVREIRSEIGNTHEALQAEYLKNMYGGKKSAVNWDEVSPHLDPGETAAELFKSLDPDTARELFQLLDREQPTRISQAVEVNATLARVDESCICGATYKLAMPAEFRNDVLKGVNTWRKYHTCSARDEMIRAYDDAAKR
jgi:hypothetical protein